ncbi:MAG TPA: hypothetical protein VEL82_04790 [Thermoplasmata archaeon]|nr:hypothetical protein [Thermoplasmata archaeon]
MPQGPPIVAGMIPLAESLGQDERSLRAGRHRAHAAALSDRSVSYGVGVRGAPAYLARARELGIPALRRTTGGTGLVHLAGDLVWSIVLPRSDPRVGRDFVRAYARLGEPLVRFFVGLGLDARWSDPPGLVDDYCPLSARGSVLVSSGRVIGAAAQHLSRDSLLHQGTVFVSVDRPLIARLFGIADGTITARLSGLRELGLERRAPASLASDLQRLLASALERPG